jgi:2-keto-4-pentenoate hydratase/2-oxohepta-3-ene-1,7-dioic acid hydratase in catechol pathway
MKLVRYEGAHGAELGVLRDSVDDESVGVIPLRQLVPDFAGNAVEDLLVDGLLDRVDWLSLNETHEEHSVLLEALLAPIARPGKILCAAMNYQAHVEEVGAAPFDKDRIVPKLFLKPPTTLLRPYGQLELPTTSSAVDWEIELAAVIGTNARNLSVDEALDCVAGYSVINDISARKMDWGLPERADSHWDNFFDWLMGKWPDGFAPLGPCFVSSSEIPDPQDLQLTLEVNNEVRQASSTSRMIFTVAELISFASRVMTLEPGDIIATGTPEGVGAATQNYLKDGDVMVGRIEGIGSIRTTVHTRVQSQ